MAPFGVSGMLFIVPCVLCSVMKSEQRKPPELVTSPPMIPTEMAPRLMTSGGKCLVIVQSDIVMTCHQWEQMTEGQGHSKDQGGVKNSRSKRKVTINPKLWPKNESIPYTIDPRAEYSPAEKEEILKAIREIEKYTCLTFEEITLYDVNNGSNIGHKQSMINFTFDYMGCGCCSTVGFSSVYDNENMEIQLAAGDGNCRTKTTILHEMLHTLGLFHEHARPDRDNYVVINYNNIDYNKYGFSVKAQFYKIWSQTFGIRYDYKSIMHYGKDYYAKPEQETIVPRDPLFKDIIGNAKGLSFLDIKTLNLVYGCNDHCSNTNIGGEEEKDVEECPGDGFVSSDCQCVCEEVGDDHEKLTSCPPTGRDISVYIDSEDADICVKTCGPMLVNASKSVTGVTTDDCYKATECYFKEQQSLGYDFYDDYSDDYSSCGPFMDNLLGYFKCETQCYARCITHLVGRECVTEHDHSDASECTKSKCPSDHFSTVDRLLGMFPTCPSGSAGKALSAPILALVVVVNVVVVNVLFVCHL